MDWSLIKTLLISVGLVCVYFPLTDYVFDRWPEVSEYLWLLWVYFFVWCNVCDVVYYLGGNGYQPYNVVVNLLVATLMVLITKDLRKDNTWK